MQRDKTINHQEIEKIVKSVVFATIKSNPEYKTIISDLIQEGMLKAIEAIDKFDPSKGASFKTFIRKCVKNEIINYLKNLSKHKSYESTEDLNIIDNKSSNYDLEILEQQIRNFIETSRDLFSEEDIEILNLRMMGYKYEEIAIKIGKTKKYVDNAIQRIKRIISKKFGI